MRVSVADIEKDGPFSAFPGVDRWMASVEGVGLVLQLPGGEGVGQTWRVRSDSRSPRAWWMIFEPGGMHRVADVVAQAGPATTTPGAPWG